MPVYEYKDVQTGAVIELVKPVADRDNVPAHLERVTVPRRVAIHGTTSSPIDEKTADASVPKGLKELSNNQVNNMVKESGYSVDKFKRVWGI